MNTKQRERAAEVARIRTRIPERLLAIEEMVESVPDDTHLGTLRALDNTITRAETDIHDYIFRDRARRRGDDDAPRTDP